MNIKGWPSSASIFKTVAVILAAEGAFEFYVAAGFAWLYFALPNATWSAFPSSDLFPTVAIAAVLGVVMLLLAAGCFWGIGTIQAVVFWLSPLAIIHGLREIALDYPVAAWSGLLEGDLISLTVLSGALFILAGALALIARARQSLGS